MIAVVMIAGISGICSAIAPLPPPPAKVKTQKMLAEEAKAEAKKAAELKKKQEAEAKRKAEEAKKAAEPTEEILLLREIRDSLKK